MRFILLLVLFPAIAPAQETIGTAQEHFILTPVGFRNSNDSTMDYTVLYIPGKNQKELYNSALLYFNKTYISPKDVISKAENQSITINGFAANAIHRNNMHVFNMNYTVNLEFKDGKIKMSAPSFRLNTFSASGRPQELLIVSNNFLDGSYLGIYNEKLKLKSDRAKTDLENFFSSFKDALVRGINAKNDW